MFLRRQTQSPPTLQRYLTLLFMFLSLATIFTVTMGYMISCRPPTMMCVGIVGAVSQVLFNLARHRRLAFPAIWDTLLILGLTCFIGLTLWDEMVSAIDHTVLVLCIMGFYGYFVYIQLKIIRVHAVLRRTRLETVQTQKMRAVGQLTAGIAHDFNNLLTVIRGNVELAEISTTPSETYDRLADAKGGADQAAALVAQLLAFSRKSQLRAGYLQSGTFFEELQGVLIRMVPAGILVNVVLDPQFKHLFCDKNLLQSSLMNLVINAYDAMENNGTIVLGCTLARPAKIARTYPALSCAMSYAILRISDDGPGIPEDILQTVAEPFFTTKSVGEGSGLGLSSAKGFAEHSGGHST